MIPSPHLAVVITPASVADDYGNPVLSFDADDGAVSTTVAGWMQPVGSSESTGAADREALVRSYRWFGSTELQGIERMVWDGLTLQVIGPSQRHEGRRGRLRHHAAELRIVEG